MYNYKYFSMYVSKNCVCVRILPDKPALRNASTRFFARPRRFSYLDVSIEAARRLTDLPVDGLYNTFRSAAIRSKTICLNAPGLASGFSIHHDDLPVPSFCTRINRLCSERLCLIEFCKKKKERFKI